MLEYPNPDPILRRAGKSASIYEEIARDAHVIGELRTLRAGIFAFNAELVPGGEDADSMQSYELAKMFFANRPAPNTEWADLDWHNYSAILHGFSAMHLGAYQRDNGLWLPTTVSAWQHSNLAFNTDHNMLVKTAENPRGEYTDETRFTCVRHMPTPKNPYGIALLSSCFWPWTFKNGGWKFFYQLTERFGIPFPIGKYPSVGATDKDIEALTVGLIKLLTDGVAAIPDDSSVNVLESKASGEPLPLLLINAANKEMSKALTSQTLATEQQGSGGSRAASETGHKRAGENQRADRALVASGRNQVINALHMVNFDGGEPPRYVFKDKKETSTDTVSRVRETAKLLPVSLDWARKELAVPAPKEGDTILEVADDAPGIASAAMNDFARPASGQTLTQGADAFDLATSAEIDQIWRFAQAAQSLPDLQTKIKNAFPGITQGALADVAKSALELEFMQGMAEADDTTGVTKQ
jgi:phage gp29-like protein